MRIKTLLLILVAFVLLISASAQAEYEQYRLTEPSEKYAGVYVTVYPLDSQRQAIMTKLLLPVLSSKETDHSPCFAESLEKDRRKRSSHN